MISAWSTCVFFGHLYKSIHFIDERHVDAFYTSPVGCSLSSTNVFLLLSILLQQRAPCLVGSTPESGDKKYEMCRDERRKIREKLRRNWKHQEEDKILFFFLNLLILFKSIYVSKLHARRHVKSALPT